LLIPLTHPPTLVRRPDRWRASKFPHRSRSSASAPNPGPPGGHLKDLTMVCRTRPRSAGHPLPPECGRWTPTWTPSPPISPPADTREGGPGDGHGRPLDRPVGRTSPVRGDRPDNGSGPGPDGDGQAADTSSAQRLTMRLASRPKQTSRPGRPGPDRTERHAHARLPSAPTATSIGTAGHQHLHLCSMPECPQAWSPSDVRAVVSSVHDGRHDRTAFRTPPAPSYPAGHGHLHPARHGEPEAMWPGNERTAPKAFGHLDRHDHNSGPPYTPSLSCGPGVCGLPTKVGSAMATLPARPQPRQLLVSLHRSSRASGALLSSEECGPRVGRDGGCHPLWRVHGAWTGAVVEASGITTWCGGWSRG
jgi:hypothetical protein